jgi:hypothetical protein
MPAIEIDFEWCRDESGYDLMPEHGSRPRLLTILSDEKGGDWLPCRVARRGGRLIPYYPLARFEALYALFASSLTPKDVFSFVDRFGPLTKKGLEVGGYDDVEIVLRQAAVMRRIIEGKHDPETIRDFNSFRKTPLQGIEFQLAFDPATKRPRLQYKPNSLLIGLWLQLAQAVSEGANLRKCPQCGILFSTGSGTGRRADARFCCTAHQEKYKSLRRSRRE